MTPDYTAADLTGLIISINETLATATDNDDISPAEMLRLCRWRIALRQQLNSLVHTHE